VADVGCGPGHVTAHLRGLGVDAFGIDLSPVAAWLRDAGFTVKAHLLVDLDQSVPGAILFANRQSS
jgi:hypothetical protein